MKSQKRIKLDLGCGNYIRGEDYTGVDKFVEGPNNIKADLWDLPFKENSVDELWSSHALEHMAVAQVHLTLKEWLRVLKRNGKAIIQVPNFDYVAKYWFIGPDRAWAEAMIFGNQAHDGEFHKCAFTAMTLRADLEAAGFIVDSVDMRWSHNQETLQATCRKPA